MELIFKVKEDKEKAVANNNVIRANVLSSIIRIMTYGPVQSEERLKAIILQEIDDIKERIQAIDKYASDYDILKKRFEIEIRELEKYIAEL